MSNRDSGDVPSFQAGRYGRLGIVIESAGRFIEQQYSGILNQSTSDQESLLLTTEIFPPPSLIIV